MKICIVSDSHDHIPLLDAAIAEAKQAGAEAVLHAGDVVAPSTLGCLKKYGLPVHVIHGNNTGDLYFLSRLASEENSIIHYHGMDAGIELAGHKVSIEEHKNRNGGITHLVNPGTIGGVGRDRATYILADLESMQFEVHDIPKSIEHQATAS